MKISKLPVIKQTVINKTKQIKPLLCTYFSKNVDTLTTSSVDISLSMSQKLLLSSQKALAKIFFQSHNPDFFSLNLLEGIQRDIPVFKGLSLKDISFIGKDLHAIIAKQGCYSKCTHCYANAQKPLKENASSVNSVLFDDIKALADGFNVLKHRTGINFVRNSGIKYNAFVFDSDCMEIAAKDSLGNIHLFPELNKLVLDGFDIKSVFDTSGWNPKSKIYQQRAEKIIEYYRQPNKMDELYQFNVSINPFHSMYEKSLELKQKGYIELSEKIYKSYVDRMSNALFTCIPLMNDKKFGVITRAMPDSIPNMQGYDIKSLTNLLNDIYVNFSQRCLDDMFSNKKHIKNENDLKNILKLCEVHLKAFDIDTDIVPSAKIKEIIEKRNPGKIDKISKDIFSESLLLDEQFEELKSGRGLAHVTDIYRKLIDITGKVYLSDNQRVIPTDIQINYKNRYKVADRFHTVDDSFVYKFHNTK